MDDPLLVRGGQALGDLLRVFDRFSGGEPPGGELRSQGFPFEKLLDDVGSPLVRPDVVDGGDVGVIEKSRGFRLLLEPAQAIGVLRERRGQDLDRDLSAEARVLRTVHLAHSAGADRTEDLVGAQARAGRERHAAARLAAIGALTAWPSAGTSRRAGPEDPDPPSRAALPRPEPSRRQSHPPWRGDAPDSDPRP